MASIKMTRWVLGYESPRPIYRLGVIDLIRGAICLFIVLGHNGLPQKFWGQSGYGYLFQLYSKWYPGTECFMVISGFLIGHMMRPQETKAFSIRTFAYSRILRLAMPYWVAVALYLTIWQWTSATHSFHRLGPTAWDSVASFLFVSDLLGTNWPSYTFWSLCTLFQAYFLWLVLYGLIGYGLTADDPNQRHRQTTRLLSSIAFALFVVGGWMLQSGRGIGWMLPTNMAYIASGWLVYQMVIGEFGRWIIPWVISVFFAAAFTSNSVRPIYAALTLLALAVAVRMEHFQVWKPFQWLTLVSTWSYSIYLTHGLVGHKIFWFAEELGISMSSGVAVAIAVVTVIASIALGSIFHRLVEVPFTRLSRYNRIDFPSLHPAAGRLAGTNHR